MAHHNMVKQSSYYKLTERINRFPQGAPASDLLFEILKILFSEREAGLVSLLPIKPFNARKASENSLHVLDYEKASEVIRSASHIGVGMCYCRHKMSHMGKNCDAPMDICMTFNNTADSLTRHGVARKVEASEGLDLLQKAQDFNLVQFGENVREKVNFI